MMAVVRCVFNPFGASRSPPRAASDQRRSGLIYFRQVTVDIRRHDVDNALIMNHMVHICFVNAV